MIDQKSPFGEISENEFAAAADFAKFFQPRGRVVLEIGGALSETIVSQIGPRQWISVDPKNQPLEIDGHRRIKGFGSKTGLPSNSVDLVFSCNAFEHIIDLPETLAELRRVMKFGASVYSHFGPIWSGPDGHHMDIEFQGLKYNFWERQIIPHWFHLLYGREELQCMLGEALSTELAEAAICHIFDSTWINRRHFEDYIEAFNLSGLSIEMLSVCRKIDYEFGLPPGVGMGKRDMTLEDASILLKKRVPAKYRDFSCRDIKVVLKKFDI
jgi:hypothetical protein